MQARLPPEAARQVARFLDAVNATAPNAVEAVWVEGSLALADFRPRWSDIDLYVVTPRPLDERARNRLAIGGTPPLQLTFATWDDVTTLARAELGAVTAATLHRHGFAVRGPDPAAIVRDVDRATLALAMQANLEAYWVPWLQRARTRFVDGAKLLHPRGVVWGASGVPRQYVTVVEGSIVSKSDAMAYVRARFDDRWHRILDEGLRLRGGVASRRYGSPFARRRDVLVFVEHAIERMRAATRCLRR